MRLVLAPAILAASLAPAPAGAEADEPLRAALARADEVASAFLAAAIKFECKESIVWDGGSVSYSYIYVRENGVTEDFRSYLGLSARDPMVPVLPEDYGVGRYLRRAFLWFQIFRAERWPHHRYSLAGDSPALGRRAFAIRFEPVPPVRPGINDWFGTAWFDEETAQLLRVVAYTPEAWDRKVALEQALREAPARPAHWRSWFEVEEITTEFGVEARGMRLPSSVHMRTVTSEVRGTRARPARERLVSQTWQRYKKYRFFATDAEEQLSRSAP
jgi:hypothetical protein